MLLYPIFNPASVTETHLYLGRATRHYARLIHLVHVLYSDAYDIRVYVVFAEPH